MRKEKLYESIVQMSVIFFLVGCNSSPLRVPNSGGRGCTVVENGIEHPMGCEAAISYFHSGKQFSDFCIKYPNGEDGAGSCLPPKANRCIVLESGKRHPMACNEARNYYISNKETVFCIYYPDSITQQRLGACGSEDRDYEEPSVSQ